MKISNILNLVVLSLAATSMIACSSKSDSNNAKTSVTQVETSLESQLKAVDAKIAGLEARKEALTGDPSSDMVQGQEIAKELADAYANLVTKSDKLLSATIVGKELSPSHSIVVDMDAAKVRLAQAKQDSEDFKAATADAAKEVQIIESDLRHYGLSREILDDKITVKKMTKSIKTMDIRADRESAQFMIDRKLKEIQKNEVALSPEENSNF